MPGSNSDVIENSKSQACEDSNLEFIFPDEIPIDAEATLDQLTGRFRSLRDGLPELVKNSKDQYSRLGVMDKEDRQIVVVLNTVERTLAVVDFAGAPAENFKGWSKWSDLTAGKLDLAADIEAGHGNGGKAFMVRGATKKAFLESCHLGKRTRKGFANDQDGRRYKPGFGVLDGVHLDDVKEDNPAACLSDTLLGLGMDISNLPQVAQDLFKKRNSYTIAVLEKIREWEGWKKQKLKSVAGSSVVEIIGGHGQTAMTIETCHVWVVADGIVVGGGSVEPNQIEPYPGFEEPREFPIPDVLLAQRQTNQLTF